MSEITLIRHGQANSGATNEEDYDRLSALGWDQARWLGAHFKAHRAPFDQVISGTLNRQRDTAIGLGYEHSLIQDPRLNEMEYFPMAKALQAQTGVPIPTDSVAFSKHVPLVFQAWERDQLPGIPERFEDFQKRVVSILDELRDMDKSVALVTSGGVITMALRAILGLDIHATVRILLGINNSSVHRLHRFDGNLVLSQYNATPHLEHHDRAFARTFV